MRLIHERLVLVTAAVLALGGYAVSEAQAAYALVDDFESYSTGKLRDSVTGATVGEGGIWEEVTNGTGFAEIQNDGSTNHLAVGWNAGFRGAYADVADIADGAAATYYLRVRTGDDTPDASIGLSDLAAPTGGFGDFEAQVAIVDDGDGGNGQFKLIARDGGGFVDLATGLVVDTWYDVWIVADNATDTYDVYFGTNVGNPDALGALVGNDLAFRNGTTDALATLYMLAGSSDFSLDVDNVHYNAVAVPEPATLALMGLGGLAMFRRR
jgi:hypothetical protein